MKTIKTLSVALVLALSGCVVEVGDGTEEITDQSESELGADIINLVGPTKWCGGQTSVKVNLRADPVTPMVVTVTAGASVQVIPSSGYTFTSSGWSIYKTYYLSSGGTVTASSPGYPSKTITIKRSYCR